MPLAGQDAVILVKGQGIHSASQAADARRADENHLQLGGVLIPRDERIEAEFDLLDFGGDLLLHLHRRYVQQ